ncbi:hypothetical protein IAQ61_011760 [Plenodomus lingam]|uniref:uncharacterized protein n=1 Tax=Leptosphaeria maculans TaxID=5022 RepID=UPI00331B16C8|nr:hypothetical protein IAQ61_011760 [Plenodomus lingam]
MEHCYGTPVGFMSVVWTEDFMQGFLVWHIGPRKLSSPQWSIIGNKSKRALGRQRDDMVQSKRQLTVPEVHPRSDWLM